VKSRKKAEQNWFCSAFFRVFPWLFRLFPPAAANKLAPALDGWLFVSFMMFNWQKTMMHRRAPRPAMISVIRGPGCDRATIFYFHLLTSPRTKSVQPKKKI
jgi:hypothetical protein